MNLEGWDVIVTVVEAVRRTGGNRVRPSPSISTPWRLFWKFGLRVSKLRSCLPGYPPERGASRKAGSSWIVEVEQPPD